MPIVRMELWTGRTKEQKGEIACEVTQVLVRIAKVKAEDVIVIFQDIPPIIGHRGKVRNLIVYDFL